LVLRQLSSFSTVPAESRNVGAGSDTGSRHRHQR
jgi:hypothetical protein